jgi:glycosyltransferase involved in cell wall biosynthesis
MLVTHVITRLIVGGAQENTVSTVLGLQSRPEYETKLISGPTPGGEGSLESEFEALPGVLEFCPELVRPVSPLRDLKALFQLKSNFVRTAPVIVHTHSGKAGVVGRWAASLAGVPIIIHTIHGPSFGDWQGALPNFIFSSAERRAGRVTTHFISVAEAMTRQYLRAGIGDPQRFSRIFSGFRLAPFLGAENDPALRAQYGIDPGDIVIGKIARFVPLKGHEDVFAIAPDLIRRAPHVKFLLAGGGPLEAVYKRRANELGLAKHFVFTGVLPPARIPALTGIMDLLVHLSVREGLPRALPQALAAAKPVVAYNCDGAGEICIDEKTGFLISPANHAAVSAKLQALISNPPLRQRLGQAGRALVRQHFPVEVMVEQIHQLYLTLLERARLKAGQS